MMDLLWDLFGRLLDLLNLSWKFYLGFLTVVVVVIYIYILMGV